MPNTVAQHTSTAAIASAASKHSYSPVTRMPNKNDLARALEEFARLENEVEAKNVHENDRDVKVFLAKGVNLRKWMKSSLADTNRSVRFVVKIKGDVTKERLDERTICDILIIKVVKAPHEQSVKEIDRQLGNYCELQLNDSVVASGGRFLYTVADDEDDENGEDNINAEEREPDATLSVGDEEVPKIIIEFEHKHRSCPELDLWCRGFFYTAGVRQVIGFKMYPQDDNGLITALAIQYGYVDNEVQVIDAISFGLRDVARQGIPDEIWNHPIRLLPNPTPNQLANKQNPWNATDNAFVTIPRGECIYDINPPPEVAVEEDLRLDLFKILFKFAK